MRLHAEREQIQKSCKAPRKTEGVYSEKDNWLVNDE
jgi:hypothetical protein